MRDVFVNIFMSIGLLLFFAAIVSLFLYSRGIMSLTRKAVYVSSVLMILGVMAWGVMVFIITSNSFALTLYFLLLGGCVTGAHLILGMVYIALRDRMARSLAQRRKQEQ